MSRVTCPTVRKIFKKFKITKNLIFGHLKGQVDPQLHWLPPFPLGSTVL